MRFAGWCRVLFAALLGAVFSIHAYGQTISSFTQNMTGVQPFQAYDGANENIDLATGNLNLQLSLISMPGRSGQNLSIGLEYDSKTFGLRGVNTGGPTTFYWDRNKRAPEIDGYQFGWRLMVPELEYSLFYTGAPGNASSSYLSTFVLTTEDGSVHQFRNVAACLGTASGDCTVTRSESDDDTFIVLDTSSCDTLTLSPCIVIATTKSGTQYYFTIYPGVSGSSLPTKIEDTNGNTITAVLASSLSIGSLSDNLGRTVTFNYQSTAATTRLSSLTYKDTNGTTQTVSLNYSPFTESPSFTTPTSNYLDGIHPNDAATEVLTSITMPTGKSYSFAYNGFGELTKIVYPTGGYTSFVYGVFKNNTTVPVQSTSGPYTSGVSTEDFRQVTERHVCRNATGSCSTEDVTKYNPTVDSTKSNNQSESVVNPLLNTTVTQFTYSSIAASGFLPQIISVTEYKGSATPLITTSYVYTARPSCGSMGPWLIGSGLPTQITTTLNDSNQVSMIQNAYDTFTYPGTSCTVFISNELSTKEFGFGSGSAGSLSRITATSWLKAGSYAETSRHILDRKLSVNVEDSSSNLIAQTQYEYDTYTAGIATSGATQHDSAINTGYTTRGNITAVKRWRNTDGTWLITRNQYDDAGNVVSRTEPSNTPNDSFTRTTSYNYSDHWANTVCTPTGGSAAAYITKITDPLGHYTSATYNSCSGTKASSTDQNSQATTMTYDLLARTTSVSTPDGGGFSNCYSDVGGATCSATGPPFSVTSSEEGSGSGTDISTTVFDGLGRTVQSQSNSDPNGNVYVDTVYDALGQISSISNPYHSTSDPTYGTTSYAYDALGRVTKITHPDGTSRSSTYLGSATEDTDEGNGTQSVQVASQKDALGRTTSVCEVASATMLGPGGTPSTCGLVITANGFLTTYSFDLLDDMTQVNQGSLIPRTFGYDSLSQLVSASNPESGARSYSYDNVGNLISRVAPLPNQSTTATVTTSYKYDANDRVTQKSYSDGTPTVNFAYDLSTATIAGGQVSIANSIGRMSYEQTLISTTSVGTMSAFSYDKMGRTASLWSCKKYGCSTGTLQLTYAYNPAGAETDRNLSGADYASTYSAVNRLTSLTKTTFTTPTNPGNLLTSVSYDPFGNIASAVFANGLTQIWSYDKDDRLAATEVGTSCSNGSCTNAKYTVGLTRAPNGKITTSNDSVNGTWTYSYDALNRLAASNKNSGQQTYSYDYDRYGNRWHQNAPQGGASSQLSFSSNNNRIDSYSYDAAGNLLNDGLHAYTYDAENRIKSVDGGSTSYIYDAEGRRLEKQSAGVQSFDYFYDREGHIAMGMLPARPLHQEIYADGLHLSTYTTNSAGTATDLYFHYSDWLGTERVRTDYLGSVCETISSLPFGDGQFSSSSCVDGDVSPMHFTGEERDTESNLDNFEARHLNSSIGRFLTPDPSNAGSGDGDPQSWNAYSYVRNDPINLTDPSGAVMCRPPTAGEGYSGIDLVCDLTDTQYFLASKEQKRAYDEEGYRHYDCSCDTQNDRAAWNERNGNAKFDWAGAAAMFVVAVAVVRGVVPVPKPSSPSRPRLPQDIKRQNDYPEPPPANNGDSTIGTNKNQADELARDLERIQQEGGTDIRVNQQQVDANGVRVGQNQPDVQYTDRNGIRQYIEYDQDPARSAAHVQRIKANDPAGVVTPKIIK